MNILSNIGYKQQTSGTLFCVLYVLIWSTVVPLEVRLALAAILIKEHHLTHWVEHLSILLNLAICWPVGFLALLLHQLVTQPFYTILVQFNPNPFYCWPISKSPAFPLPPQLAKGVCAHTCHHCHEWRVALGAATLQPVDLAPKGTLAIPDPPQSFLFPN